MTGSIVALLAVLAAAFLVVSLSMRARSRAARWLVVIALWCAAIAATLIVDVDVPLSESHFRSDDAPAPLWIALCATFVRYAALASIFLARLTSVAGRSNGPQARDGP